MNRDAVLIVKLNIEHYERLLQAELDPAKRATVERLLREERGKLSRLEAEPKA
jgi:hypothetical protein